MGAELETAFPLRLAEELFELIRARGIRVLRYCDLDLRVPLARSHFRYVGEYAHFRYGQVSVTSLIKALTKYVVIRKRLNRLPFIRRWEAEDPPPSLFLQHDADRYPDHTLSMMELERRHGLRSSNYFFVKHADPSEPYEIDETRLRSLEQDGFEVGYHQNAFERSGYVEKTALAYVAADLAWLRARFSIRSFVPHGGRPSPHGANNCSLGHKGELQSLLLAYNGNCVLKEFTWSDGGLRFRAPGDPREFLRNLPDGSRAMMLMHPQYYGSELRADWQHLPIAKERWWRDLWQL